MNPWKIFPGVEELTVKLAEYEKKISGLQEDQKLRDDQDSIIQKQSAQLKKYEEQLIESGKLKAQLMDKEEMIAEYSSQLEELRSEAMEYKNQLKTSEETVEPKNAIDAINSDPKLTSAHKKTMMMLYSQYTSRAKKDNADAFDEEDEG